MTGTRRVFVRAMLTGILAAACWGYALLTAGGLATREYGISVRLTEAAVTNKMLEQEADRTRKGAPVCSAAWTRGGACQTAGSELGETTKVRVVAAYGDIRRALPVWRVKGALLAEDDADGCLIDEKTAWELFHSTDALGAEVSVEGKRYTVRGIVKTYEQTLIIRNADAKYENLEFSVSDPAAAKQSVETVFYRMGVTEDRVILQGGLLAGVALGLTWLPAWVGCAMAAVAFLRRGWRVRRNVRSGLLHALAGVVLAGVCIVGLMKTAYWPQSFLPTKWSDFSFWGKLFDGWKTQWKAVSLMTPLPGDIVLLAALRRCAIMLLLSLSAAGWSASEYRRWRIYHARRKTAEPSAE